MGSIINIDTFKNSKLIGSHRDRAVSHCKLLWLRTNETA